MEDPQIIALYISRDEEAVAQTVQKYTVYCRAVAQHILQSPEDAEEALNDTWLAAWNSIPPHEPSCLQTFLGRLTRNISLNKLRAAKTKKRGAAEAQVVFEEIAEWLASGEDVERQVSEQALTEAINTFLGSIPDTERNVFVRRYWYMQPVSEIAAAHGFSESKVKSMLFRTRKKLYARLKKEGYL